MAALTLSGLLAYDDGVSAPINSQVVPDDLTATVATEKPLKTVQSIGTSEEAITLPEGGGPGWCFFKNLDTTNYIELRVATAGAKFCKLLPGEFALLRLGSGAQVPFAIANVAACLLEITCIPT